MRLLIKKLAQTNLAILLRNSVNFRPIVFKKPLDNNSPIAISDAFLWRTDNGYETKFKYSDILNLFYKIKDSWVEFHFYSKDGRLIKIEKNVDLDLSNELDINSKYLDKLEDYGTFYIYHFLKNNSKNLNNKDIIVNRCYLGYSQNNNLHSFVHGNTLAKFSKIYSKKNIISDIVKTSLFKNHTYTIQKCFDSFDKNELFFTNPTSKTINFSFESSSHQLKPNCAILIKTKSPIISISSNCLLFRPTIFSYKGKYLDVHHS